MGSRYFFAIYTPLQLINSYEFYMRSKGLGVDDNITVLLIAHPNNLDRLHDLLLKVFNCELNVYKADNYSFGSGSILNLLASRIHLRCLASRFSKESYDYLVHSSADKYFLRFLSIAGNYKNKVIVDDGLATCAFLKESPLERYQSIKPTLNFKYYFNAMERLLFNMPSRYVLGNYKFFTMFYDVASYPFKEVLLNDFSVLRDQNAINVNCIAEDLIHFIGQPLSELGLVSETEYFKIVAGLNRTFPGMVYYPHPSESKHKLDSLSRKGVSIANGVYGYEVHLLTTDVLPGHIYTVYSSAIITISKIFSGIGIRFSAIRVQPEDLFYSACIVDKLEDTYQEIINAGISVIYKNIN